MERLTALLLAAAMPQLTERRRREGGGGATLSGRAVFVFGSAFSTRYARGRAIARVYVFVCYSVMRTQVPQPMIEAAPEGEPLPFNVIGDRTA